jgi:glycosyltransferase involved in cell wall biosynthesis
MVNDAITVVTVTKNNDTGLLRTLASIAKANCRPHEVVVIDGGCSAETAAITLRYKDKINIRVVSEADHGIYDAMNKGLRKVRTPLVHYLNAGDEIFGELYSDCRVPSLFRVKIIDPQNNNFWMDRIKLAGYGYCHQGIVFPSNHLPFNSNLQIAADFESVCLTFPSGLGKLPVSEEGGFVVYKLGGVSTVRYRIGNREIISAAWHLLSRWRFLRIASFIVLKSFVPRNMKRYLAQSFAIIGGPLR